MALLLFTGMRRGEVLGLKWKDVNFEKNTIHVVRNVVFPRGINDPVVGTPKTDSGTRYVPIAPELRAYLEPQDAEDFIIGGRKPLTLCALRRMMERIGRKIDLHGASAHIFRHSYATMLNDAGVPIKTIQGIIGHADFTNYRQPLHPRKGRKKAGIRPLGQPPACDLRFGIIKLSGSKLCILCAFCAQIAVLENV